MLVESSSKLWQIPDSGLINLIVLVTECFYFCPSSDKLSQINLSLLQTADVSGTTFMFILHWQPACESTGASCQNNTFMDRWLEDAWEAYTSFTTTNISDTSVNFFFFFKLNRHFVAEKYPKYLAKCPTTPLFKKLTKTKKTGFQDL